jgi:Big-like domain-containing protein
MQLTDRSGVRAALAAYATITFIWTSCGGGASSPQVAISSIQVTPAYQSVMLGKTMQFTATGTYTDGSLKDITASVDWTSSNEAMVTLDSSGVATPHATGGVTVTATLGGTSGQTLVAVTPAAGARLVWFTPDLASADMLNLFLDPEEWPNARANVQVFKFYSGQLLPPPLNAPADTLGQNTEPNLAAVGAFSKLNQWGLDIGVEAGAVKPGACTADDATPTAQSAIQSVQSNGGVMSYLAMDEPYFGGVVLGTCGWDQTVAETVRFIQLMHAFSPTLQIGDIEPYPEFSEAQLETWITTLEADGVTLPFFHLDVDRLALGSVDPSSDLTKLQAFCQSQGIAFGVIFNATIAVSSTQMSDQDYYDQTMQWVQTVKSAMGRPQHSIFQSWVLNGDGLKDVPINLPESDPTIYSHTRLINDGLAALGP